MTLRSIPGLAVLLPLALGGCAGGEMTGPIDSDGGQHPMTVDSASVPPDSGRPPDAQAADRVLPDIRAADRVAPADAPPLDPNSCLVNADCPFQKYCQRAVNNYHCAPSSVACMRGYVVYCDTLPGVCAPMPAAAKCTNVSAPVCACDGKVYQNGCLMAAAGASLVGDADLCK